MEVLILRQRVTLEAIKRSFGNFKKDSKLRKTPSYAKNHLEKLTTWSNAFMEVHKEIVNLIASPKDIEDSYFKEDIELFDEIFIEYKSLVDEIVSQETCEVNKGGNEAAIDGAAEVRLPQISLPSFSGKYEEWPSFRDLFTSLVHGRAKLSQVEKFHYLKTCITGEAEGLLKATTITDSNYNIAWKILCDRYENPQALLNSYLRKFFELANATESAISIKDLLDRTTEVEQAVDNLEVEDLWQAILIYMTANRLPPQTRQMWEQQSASKREASFIDLKRFLEIRFKALEASDSRTLSKRSNVHTIKNVRTHHAGLQLCFACKGAHNIRSCQGFAGMNFHKKFEVVKSNGLCLNCLAKGHLVRGCPSKSKCGKCSKAHHTLLHKEAENSFTSDTQGAVSTSRSLNTNESNINALNVSVSREVLLATALIRLESARGSVVLRALLDQGSQASFISESATQQLGLKRKAINANVYGIGMSNAITATALVHPTLLTRDNEHIPFEALVLDKLTRLVPTSRAISTVWEQLENLELADPHFDHPGRIDLLLGADVYSKIVLGEIRRLSIGPVMQNTRLGWIIYGPVDQPNVHRELQSFKVEVINDEISSQLRRFWEIEEGPAVRLPTEEEEQCEKFFIENTIRDETGRYIVRLPFKSEEHKRSLGASRNIAMASFQALERRFVRDPELHKEYSECIQEYLDLGYLRDAKDSIDIVNLDGVTECRANYLPHHAVMKDSTTTKLRIVFDASRKTSSGISLNDSLLTGPPLINDLIAVLINWRLFKYVFVADITKMYLQILLHPEDAEYQRILFRFSPKSEIRDLILTRVMFGETCAAYLAIRCLLQLAKDEAEQFPEALQIFLKEFFVDDWLSGANTIEGAIRKRERICELLRSGGFILRKWLANDENILREVPSEDLGSKTHLNMNLDEGYKSLDIVWHPSRDEFGYRLSLTAREAPYSKRQVLSDVARLYDPMGWLAPVIITAKIILQSLWLTGSNWDEPLTSEVNEKWTKFRDDSKDIEQIRIPRWLCSDEAAEYELHGFCDASREAYSAVIYLVTRNNQQEATTRIVMAKTKVAPIRQVSIPRLELCGAVLLAKTVTKVKDTLNNFPRLKVCLWTDFTIVLSWIKGHPSRWTTFVANRTTEIYNAVGNTPWHHVPTKENPADLASRGVDPRNLVDDALWWTGPAWLLSSSDHWPTLKDFKHTELEQRRLVVNFAVSNLCLDEIMHRYSSWTRLIRVTAHCLRFVRSARGDKTHGQFLTTAEITLATELWIRHVQQLHYTEEIRLLKNHQFARSSKIASLYPFIDDKGVLRVGGRLSNSTLAFGEAHPIILPKNGKLTELLIQHTHVLTLHGDVTLMLASLRKRFWIIDARNAIRFQIHKCNQCFRTKVRISKQLMANLPTARVTISRPFTHVGIDYCGPIWIKERLGRGCRRTKGYIVVFVCLAVKAIHIELVSDLSTKAFWAALQRFIGRRGLCSDIYSDCGTNFVGAEAELKRIIEANMNAAEPLANLGITWHFNPPASPHFGGLWEAGVKSIKRHLYRVLGDASLTFEEMYTTLVKIEACLNSRPLCRLNDDPFDISALTPGHFLVGDTLLAAPENDLTELKMNRLDRWQLTQRLAQTFWIRWKSEYLPRLQQRPKWLTKELGPKIGDLCLVRDDRLASYRWPLAKIVALHPGKTGLVRVVSVFAKGNTFKRPVAKLAVLPSQ